MAQGTIRLRAYDGVEWLERGGSVTNGISDGQGDASNPVLALNNDGNPVIAWQNDGANGPQIYLRTLVTDAWVEPNPSSASGTGRVSRSSSMAECGRPETPTWA